MRRGEQGFVMIWTIIFFTVFFSIATTYATFGYRYFKIVLRTSQSLDALALAEAGGDAFLTSVNADNSYAGTNGTLGQSDSCSNASAPVTLFSTAKQGKGTYESCVKPGTIANEKVVYSTGKIYYPATASTPTTTRKVKLIIAGTLSTGYTVYSGPGGLLLNNNVTLTSGPVYVGGKLVMTNNSSIGTVASPQTVYVADNGCPYPATASYPQNCGNNQGNPPYSIQLSNGAYIRGSVYAPNTISDPTHLTNPGFVSSSVPATSMPAYDHNTVVAAITNNQAASTADCSSGNTTTWNANTKFTGNVSTSNNCSVTVNGDVWITGNLTLGNNSNIIVGNGLGSAPKIVIDGSGGLNTGNNSAFIPNGGGIGFLTMTFYSRNAANTGANACSPTCSSVTGLELANSTTWITINLANNFSGANSSVFYARWSELYVGNNATVGALLGQYIVLNNNGNLIFNSSSALGTYTWDVKYYEQIYN